jgi:bacillithiol system protein YtxJ
MAMKWNLLTTEVQLKELLERSNQVPQVIFKYSSRCSISEVAKSRLERKAAPSAVEFYFLDIIAHRSLSNKVAKDLAVHHESPQILLIRNGECIYEESHLAIQMGEIEVQLM